MTTWYSTEMTNIVAVPSVKLPVSDMSGKLRSARVSYAQGAVAGEAEDVLELCQLPAGRVRLLGYESNLYINNTTGSATVDIGWKAYTDLDGDAVAADPNGLNVDTDVDTVGFFTVGIALIAEGQQKLFESQTGVILTMTFAKILVASTDYIYGNIIYATD